MNLKRLSNTAIIAGLLEGLGMSAEGLRKAAPYYVEARERGLDLSGFTSPVLSYLPDVASGKLDAEMLVRFGGFAPALLAVAATLVPEDQKAVLANNGKVQVVESTGKVCEVRLADLSLAVLRQVVGEGRVRTPTEQKLHMAPAPRPVVSRVPTVQRDEPDEWDLRGALDSTQMVHLEKRAAEAGMTPAQYAVQCMVSHRRIKDKVATVTRETRRELQAALARPVHD